MPIKVNYLSELHTYEKKGQTVWACGPIKDGNTVEDHVPDTAIAYYFSMYDKPKEYAEDEAQYHFISGSYWYVISREEQNKIYANMSLKR